MENQKETKELKEYKQSVPEQLSLFEMDEDNVSDNEDYSNMVNLYDSLPKYFHGNVKRTITSKADILPPLVRDFKHHGNHYKLLVSPAPLMDKKTGKVMHYYPGQREELVEDALRKILSRKSKGIYLDEDSAVKFTLYELQKELKKRGHGYNINEIKQAIEICSKTIIEIKDKSDKEVSITTTIFPFVARETKEDGYDDNRCVVMFNPLVTKAIDSDNYKLINYATAMKFKMNLARWLYKRMSYNFTQASTSDFYKIKMSTIIRDSGMKNYPKNFDNIRQIEKALEELKSLNTISNFEVEKRMDGRKIIDALFILEVSESFMDDVIKCNKIQKIEEPLDNPEKTLAELEEELFKDDYGLHYTPIYIKNLLAKITSKEKLEILKNALEAAKIYIKKTPTAIAPAVVKKSIREGWKPDIKIKLLEEKEIQQQEEKESKQKQDIANLKKQKWWKDFIKELQTRFNKEDYERWFSSLEPIKKEKESVVINTPSKFVRDWIIREYLEDHQEAVEGKKEEKEGITSIIQRISNRRLKNAVIVCLNKEKV